MDPNTALEAATEGAKALNKFQEIIQKIFSPRWTRKQADADAYADERKLQTIRENPDMEIVYIGNQMNAREKAPEALAWRAEQRMLTESIRQEDNLEHVLEIAAEQVQNADAVSDDPVDDDWLTRLFNIVKDINTEEMQYVWGKILAGEIAQPGSFSIRTLETVRNLTKAEAESFQKLMPVIMKLGDSFLISSDDDLLSNYGITYSMILKLDECGLITSNGLVQLTLTVSQHKNATIYNGSRLINILGVEPTETKVSVAVFLLTKAGRELYSILEHNDSENYPVDFAATIFNNNKKKVKISVHNINFIGEDFINYKLEAIKTFVENNGDAP